MGSFSLPRFTHRFSVIMESKQIDFGNVRIRVPHSWQDITEEVETDDVPFTLAQPDEGVGALQFSFAHYTHGEDPSLNRDNLLDMVSEFGRQRALGPPFDEATFEDDSLSGASMSFHDGDDFIRAWFVSDRRNVALVTYVCEWGCHPHELSSCESIVRSLQFLPA